MTTIKDVAELAGVSFKTVARVINHANVRPELRERVTAAIQQLDYRPTLAARQLATQRSFFITLIMPPVVGSYFARWMLAVSEECHAVGHHLVTEIYDPAREDGLSGGDATVRSDAIILIPPFADHEALLQRLAKRGVPIVRLGPATPDSISPASIPIAIDDTAISTEMVDHLIACGHRRIGMIAHTLSAKATESRVDGYRAALQKAGIAYDPDLLVRCDFHFADGVAAATRLLALRERPTAIFAAADYPALGAMAQVRKLGYRVPEDIAIAGFDDSLEGRMTFPPLTTVRQPVREFAKAAVAAATGNGLEHPPFQSQLVLRGSTTGSNDLCTEAYAV